MTLDLRGYRCPEPLALLRKTIKQLTDDADIRVLADDPTTLRDIPFYCQYREFYCEIKSSTSPYEFIIKTRLSAH